MLILLPVDPAVPPTALVKAPDPHAQRNTVYDPELPQSDYDELAAQGIDGLRFLPRPQYDQDIADKGLASMCQLDHAMIFGLTNGLPPARERRPAGLPLDHLAAEALALGHACGCGGAQASAGLSRRVRLPPQPAQDPGRGPDRGARHRAARRAPAADHAITDRRHAALPLVSAT
jgi:hypothetical protein